MEGNKLDDSLIDSAMNCVHEWKLEQIKMTYSASNIDVTLKSADQR